MVSETRLSAKRDHDGYGWRVTLWVGRDFGTLVTVEDEQEADRVIREFYASAPYEGIGELKAAVQRARRTVV